MKYSAIQNSSLRQTPTRIEKYQKPDRKIFADYSNINQREFKPSIVKNNIYQKNDRISFNPKNYEIPQQTQGFDRGMSNKYRRTSELPQSNNSSYIQSNNNILSNYNVNQNLVNKKYSRMVLNEEKYETKKKQDEKLIKDLSMGQKSSLIYRNDKSFCNYNGPEVAEVGRQSNNYDTKYSSSDFLKNIDKVQEKIKNILKR